MTKHKKIFIADSLEKVQEKMRKRVYEFVKGHEPKDPLLPKIRALDFKKNGACLEAGADFLRGQLPCLDGKRRLDDRLADKFR